MNRILSVLFALAPLIMISVFQGCSNPEPMKLREASPVAIWPKRGVYSTPQEIVKRIFLSTYPLHGGQSADRLVTFSRRTEVAAIRSYLTPELYSLLSIYSRKGDEARSLSIANPNDQLEVGGLDYDSILNLTSGLPLEPSYLETITGDIAEVTVQGKYEWGQGPGEVPQERTSIYRFVRGRNSWLLADVEWRFPKDTPSSIHSLRQFLPLEIHTLEGIIDRGRHANAKPAVQ